MVKKQKSNKFIQVGLKIIFITLMTINLLFSSWYLIHKDVYFYTDIARDFLLLDELDHKKIILIGPRSSTNGLFHGPLWAYLNYPAYKISGGDPLIVGWFWMFLIVVFLTTSFVIAKKLFNRTTAYLYVLLLSLMLVREARGLWNPYGALFLLPSFFYFFIRYSEKLKVKYLIILLLITGCIIQFQMAVGIPMLILLTFPVLYYAIKKKHVNHLLAYFVLFIPLSTFLLFEIRHQFTMFKAILHYAFDNNLATNVYPNYFSLILDRLKIMTTSGHGLIFDGDLFKTTLIVVITTALIYYQIRQNRYKNIYLWAGYFYVGFYALSVINKSGGMSIYYYMELWPLVFLIFTSLITSKYKYFFAGTFILLYAFNSTIINANVRSANEFIGKNLNSWAALSEMARKTYAGEEKEFGYFIYGPDTLAYQAKYAMNYENRRTKKNGFYFQKKPITYLVIEPPPPNQPQFDGINWTENQVGIKQKPQSVIKFSNGYKVEKYVLNNEQIKIPWDSTIDTGIHFR